MAHQLCCGRAVSLLELATSVVDEGVHWHMFLCHSWRVTMVCTMNAVVQMLLLRAGCTGNVSCLGKGRKRTGKAALSH